MDTVPAPATDIHPELPPSPAWATERDETDAAEGYIVDQHVWQFGGYRIEHEQLHSRRAADGKWRSSPPSINFTYRIIWPDGDGESREQFCVMPYAIQTLIEALQAAQAVMTK